MLQSFIFSREYHSHQSDLNRRRASLICTLICKMSPSFFLLALCLPGFLAVPSYKALWQFRNMILCVQPDSWPVLDYADYGCWCGKGGSGTPVDELDRCCQVHDQCYDDAMQNDACWPILDNPYTEMYSYDCDSHNKNITCRRKNDLCEMFICECDRLAAMCFARSKYNPENAKLPSYRCQ
ncbi:unnamed protein product [Gadus morhua 'NCC']